MLNIYGLQNNKKNNWYVLSTLLLTLARLEGVWIMIVIQGDE